MENRFGLKDLVLIVLLLAVLGAVWFSMLQYDRQFAVMQRMESSLRQQQGELAELNRTLTRGVPMTGTTQAAAGYDSPKGNPFKHILEAEAQPDFARGDWLVENFGVK